jgi:hypothetical protein
MQLDADSVGAIADSACFRDRDLPSRWNYKTGLTNVRVQQRAISSRDQRLALPKEAALAPSPNPVTIFHLHFPHFIDAVLTRE